MKIYNKLVRDNILKIIKDDNKNCEFTILNDEKYIKELHNKLLEESHELIESTSSNEMINEIADIYEVLDAIITFHKIDKEQIKKQKYNKSEKNGRFEKRIFLESVQEKENE